MNRIDWKAVLLAALDILGAVLLAVAWCVAWCVTT